MLILIPLPYMTDVFLARMVIPLSLSRSPESITRSSYDLIFAVCVTLLQHLVNKRGFAVVNVSYNCDITKVFSYQNNYLSIIFLWQKIILSYKILFIFVNLVIISCFIAKIKI